MSGYPLVILMLVSFIIGLALGRYVNFLDREGKNKENKK